MAKEVADHSKRHHWQVVPRSEVPKDQKVLPAVWAMRRKCHIDTHQVYKWKACLNVHGGKQEFGVNYWETYSPVVNWTSIRLFLILAIINKWHTRQIDFVQAYPQAPIQCDMYMEIPMGFEIDGDRKSHVLKLKQNLYGQKQAGHVWNEYLKEGLQCIGFTPSKVDECVFYRGTTIFLVYVDDCIIIDPQAKNIDKVISDLKKEKFDIDELGNLSDYLGVKIENLDNNYIKLSQPHLIDQIIKDMHFQANTKPKDTPSLISKVLQRDEGGKPFDEIWSYPSIIGKLNFLEKSSRLRPSLLCASMC